MPQLNLTTKTKEQEIVLQHLKPMVSDALAEKINNGVKIQKDGKTLLNKKDLDGFIEYAYAEALKISKDKKSGNTLAVDGTVIMGWAIHYFEEDSIEGTLYNEDGTEYKIQPKSTAKAPTVKAAPPKPQPKPQMSMFDLLDAKPEEPAAEGPNDEPTDEDYAETAEQFAKEEKAKPPQQMVSPMYQKYLDVQEKYPHAVVAMRLGDFYEVFGKNAEMLADELHLTLTGRDCGLESRVPMVGFPYHASDTYLKKMLSNGHAVVLIETDGIRKLPSVQNVDLETGEILSEEEMREFDGDIDETIPTVSGLLSGYTSEQKTDKILAKEIAAVIDDDDEDDFDLSAFDAEAVAVLSEIFGDEIELR